MQDIPDPGIEETQPVAVSDLRSRFEQLAVNSTTSRTAKRLSGGHDLLAPVPPSPRPRSSSITEEQNPSSRILRGTASSSDLKVATKRPPPVPPPRGSRANSPSPTSPLLHPVALTDSAPSHSQSHMFPATEPKPSIKAALARKPPPPPPPSTPRNVHDPASAPGISSLISKFG